MMDTPKPEAQNKKCKHALMMNLEDGTTVPYWDCVYCGAVAVFNPAIPGVSVLRES
jgi:hypothetical protein